MEFHHYLLLKQDLQYMRFLNNIDHDILMMIWHEGNLYPFTWKAE